MTICIAAICDSNRQVVVAADRMLTFPAPTNLEFETEESKIEELARSCVALASGSVACATEVLRNVKRKLEGNQKSEYGGASEILKEEYAALRLQKCFEQVVVPPLGLDFLEFMKKGLSLPNYLQAHAGIYQALVGQQQQFNLGVEFIVASVDNGGAHVSAIMHPGTLLLLDKPGYGAIGSGGIHATLCLSLCGQTGQKNLDETLYNVYAAKCAAEAAPGVGKETDIAVVDKDHVRHCDRPVLEELGKTFSASNKKELADLSKLVESYERQCKEKTEAGGDK